MKDGAINAIGCLGLAIVLTLIGIGMRYTYINRPQSATYYKSGEITASGDKFNPSDMTCAAREDVPFGSWLRVETIGEATPRVVYVQVNDRCKEGLDLTPTAFQKLAPLNRGRITIKYKIVD